MCKLRRWLTFRRAELFIIRLGALLLLAFAFAKLIVHEWNSF